MVALLFLLLRPGASPQPGGREANGTGMVAPEALAQDSVARLRPAHAASPRDGETPRGVHDAGASPDVAPKVDRSLRVVSEEGTPVAGAEVGVLDDLPDVSAWSRRIAVRPARARGTTQVDGSFVVAAEAPRAGALRVRAPGFVEATVALEPFPSEIRLGRARRIRVRVIDDRARPIAGATVRVAGGDRVLEIATDADGHAELFPDATEQRWLEVFADGFALQLRALAGAKASPSDEITIVLDVGRPLTGRVVAAEDGQPLAGATVKLVSQGGDHRGSATAATGPDGSFVLRTSWSPYGTAVLHATAPDRLLGIVSSSFDPLADASLVIPLERGRNLSGIVQDGAGAPIAGARVQALPVYWHATSGIDGEALTLDVTDAEGRFRVRVANPGSDALWHVVARGPTGEWGSMPVRGVESGGAPLVVVLEGLGFVEGRVVTAAGVGVAGVRVRPKYTSGLEDWLVGQETAPVWDGGVPHHAVSSSGDSTVTTAEGTFRLGPLPAGDLELFLDRGGQPLGRPMSARVTSGKTTTLDRIVLDDGEIHGVVLDASGRAVRGARVSLTPERGGWGGPVPREMKTDEAGRFRFDALPPGAKWSIYAHASDGSNARLEHVVPRPEPLEVRVSPLARLLLMVTRGGRAYEGLLSVSWNGTSSTQQISYATNEGQTVRCAAGEVSMPLMPGFSITVHAQSIEAEPASASAPGEFDPGDPLTCRVTLDLRVAEPREPAEVPPEGR